MHFSIKKEKISSSLEQKLGHCNYIRFDFFIFKHLVTIKTRQQSNKKDYDTANQYQPFITSDKNGNMISGRACNTVQMETNYKSS